MLFTSAVALLGAVAIARGQLVDDDPIPDDVPRGVPIPGDYTGALRPQIHFSPPRAFMNDPNGMFVDGDGVWHMYYQCEVDDLMR